MELKGKKILVTGAGGFIGSHLTEMLIRQGFDVRAFVHYNAFSSWGWLDSFEPELKKSLDVFQGDVRDANGVRPAMRGCDVVLCSLSLYGYVRGQSYRPLCDFLIAAAVVGLTLLMALRWNPPRRATWARAVPSLNC